MSNNQGYIKSVNEWRIENLNVSGKLHGPGNHVKMNAPTRGALIEVKNKYNAKYDIIRVEDYKKNELFRIDKDGDLFLKGEMVNFASVPASVSTSHLQQSKTLTPQLQVELSDISQKGSIQVEDGESIYFGNPTKKGCWKLHTDEKGRLIIDKKLNDSEGESGMWVTRHIFD